MNNGTVSVDARFLKGNPTAGLVMATFGFFVGFAAVSLYGPAAKNFKDAMGLSGILLGLLVAAPQLSGSLLRIPFGAWVDKEGGKKPMLILLLLSIIGMAGVTTILFLYYPDHLSRKFYPIILFFGFLSGCGVATFSVGIPQTAYWFPKKRQGWALGTYAGLGNMAPGIFVLVLPFALISLGLAGAYAAWFVFLVIGTVIYALYAHDAYSFQFMKQGMAPEAAATEAAKLGQEIYPTGTLINALKMSARNGKTWGLVALYFTSFGGFLALTAWLPSYWILFHHLSLRQAGLLTAIGFALLASVIRVWGGKISDKRGGENVAIISFFVVLAGSTCLVLASSFALALTGELLIGAGMGVANAAVFKLVSKYVPEAVGGASGWVGGLGAFGGFVVPPLLGLFVDMYGSVGYSKGFIVYIVLAIIAIGISIFLKSRSS